MTMIYVRRLWVAYQMHHVGKPFYLTVKTDWCTSSQEITAPSLSTITESFFPSARLTHSLTDSSAL